MKSFHFFLYQTTRFISPLGIAAEWVFLAIAIAMVALFPLLAGAWLAGVRTAFNKFASHQSAAVVAIGVLPIVIRMLMLPMAPVPAPSIHDEFSHLLLADTLAHGRLANPQHAMWQHFETIHEIQRPTYSSMYPPLQGMFLALGQVMFHEPWIGVVISVGLMFMSICWMLQGWMPPSWALYGTLLAVLKFGIVGFWMNSYMGGAPPAIAGSLLLGALPRLIEGVKTRTALLMALGIIMLLNSRPFEGGLLTCCALGYLLWNWRERAFAHRTLLIRRLVIPMAAILMAGFAFTGYFNWRVTHSAFKMPYAVNRDTYGWPENLAILPPKQIHSVHPVIQAMYEKEIDNRSHYASPARIIDSLVTRFFDSWVFYVGPSLTLALMMVPMVLRWRNARVLVSFCAVIAILNLFQLLLYPQHLAPVAGVIMAVLTFGVKYLYENVRALSPIRSLYLLAVLPILLSAVAVFKLEAEPLGISLSYWERAYEIHRDSRAKMIKDLDKQPGKFLIIVRYEPWHSPDQEWVYNSADIDGSKIVWAREMDPQSDAKLIRYFAGRTIYLLQPDLSPIQLTPYESSSSPAPLTSDSSKPWQTGNRANFPSGVNL